jgi:hypothetical protein
MVVDFPPDSADCSKSLILFGAEPDTLIHLMRSEIVEPRNAIDVALRQTPTRTSNHLNAQGNDLTPERNSRRIESY